MGFSGNKAINSTTRPLFFSFSPSQQGTWSLLGANYWPSVTLGWEEGLLLERLHLEEKSFCFRKEKRWEEKAFASL